MTEIKPYKPFENNVLAAVIEIGFLRPGYTGLGYQGHALLTGLEDGWKGCPITENPYPCYTEQWEDWLCGWEDGKLSG